MKVRIVPAKQEHLEAVAANARPEDRAEFIAASGCTPLQVLERGAALSTCWAGLVDDEPVCVFGVSPVSTLTGIGCPWMVATPAMERQPRALMRASRVVMDDFRSRYTWLTNFVDNRNQKAIDWLRWLGFSIGEPQPVGRDGALFRRFDWRRDDHV